MTKAAVATAFGGPEVLAVIDVDTPVPGPGEVLVEVRAAGVNPIDAKSYSGMFGTDPATLPRRLGSEAAGVVTAVGTGVHEAAVGDEVIVYPVPGAYATEVVVPVAELTAKPEELGWAEAAGLLLTGATAVHALTAVHVVSGETVLIHGGSGGVGLMAVQLGVARGATVIATAGAASHDLLSSLGATPIVYGAGLADRVREVAPGGVDAALDLVGTDEAVETSLELVDDRSRIVTIAAFGRAAADGIVLIGGGPGADPGTEIRAGARAELASLAGEGKLRVVVGATFPLADVAAAHRAIMSSHSPGKIVLTVS
jgi:NADPH2:quinone reductase